MGEGEKMTKGWKSESLRHSLSAKKIKTGQKEINRNTKYVVYPTHDLNIETHWDKEIKTWIPEDSSLVAIWRDEIKSEGYLTLTTIWESNSRYYVIVAFGQVAKKPYISVDFGDKSADELIKALYKKLIRLGGR